jgi:hypothetical protein
VSLQRDMHDWRAIFAFTQAPGGNFSFTFFISLIAEPNLKFNYDKRTYRPVQTPQLIAPTQSAQAPVATITAPANNASFVQGTSETFTGTATDPVNGALSGGSLVWRDNVSGQIGTGTSFSTASLAAGAHVITLTATDSQGLTGSATINVNVTAPPPTPP